MLTLSIGIVVAELLKPELNSQMASLHERFSVFEAKFETVMNVVEDSEQIGAALSAVQDIDGHGMPEPEDSFELVSVDGRDANNATEPLPSGEALQEQSDVSIVTVGNEGLTHTGSNLASGTEDGDIKATTDDEFDYLALQNGAMVNQRECFFIDDNFSPSSFRWKSSLLCVHACSGASVNEARVDGADSSFLSDEAKMVSTHDETEVELLTTGNDALIAAHSNDGQIAKQHNMENANPRILVDLSNCFNENAISMGENIEKCKKKGGVPFTSVQSFLNPLCIPVIGFKNTTFMNEVSNAIEFSEEELQSASGTTKEKSVSFPGEIYTGSCEDQHLIPLLTIYHHYFSIGSCTGYQS